MSDLPTLDDYERIREIGRGPFSAVYVAHEKRSGSRVALKIFDRSFADLADYHAFRHQMARASRLKHPAIVSPSRVYGRRPSVAMPYFPRGSLRSYEGSMVSLQAAAVLGVVLEALVAAESVGVRHGRLKLENVLIADDDGIRAADFGFGRLSPAWSTGATPGERDVDGRPSDAALASDNADDLYQLASMWLELVIGIGHSFRSQSQMLLWLRIREAASGNGRPPSPQDDEVIAFFSHLSRQLPASRADRRDASDELVHLLERYVGPDWRRLASVRHPADGVVRRGMRRFRRIDEARPDEDLRSHLIVRAPPPIGGRARREPPSVEGLLVHAAEQGILPVRSAADEDADVAQCTVFAPSEATIGTRVMIQVFAHWRADSFAASQSAAAIDQTATVRGFRSLVLPVHRPSRIAIELGMPGCALDSTIETLDWRQEPESVQFVVTVPDTPELQSVFGTVTVSVDDVPIGSVKFTIALTDERVARTRVPVGESVRRYSKAFVSYAARDRDEVFRRVQMLTAFGISYFQDILSLRPGDRWERRLECGIDECDLFLLFWSPSAKRSAWVRREVLHALARSGGVDSGNYPEIRPVIVSQPVPKPWKELSGLHFNDVASLALDRELTGS